jgi:uncharacterized protein (TIGR02145 family)
MKKALWFSVILFIGYVSHAQPVTDIEGNEYKTVKIGKQIWTASNLRTTKLNDSTSIQLVTDGSEWSTLTTAGYCWYDNDQAKYQTVYGALYNWHAVNSGKLCPAGWHVPGDEEWKVLTDLLGGIDNAGNKLKEAGTKHWNSPNTGAINSSGWSSLPGGRRNAGGVFAGTGEMSYFWTSTASADNKAFYRGIGNADPTVDRYSYNAECGFSVRCIKD